MKRLYFAMLSDVLFFFVCAFVVTFCVTRYFFGNWISSLVIAIGTASVVALVAFVLMSARRKKSEAASLSESHKKSLALHLSVCSDKSVASLFKIALNATYVAGNCLEDDENIYIFNFKMTPISADEIASYIRFETEKRKQLYCNAISPDALSLAEDFSITVKTIGEIYVLLKDQDLLPEKYALGEVKKQSVWKRIKKRFNRKLCPSLFFCGLTLLFFSFFTFYPIYYIVVGGILLVLSAISALIGQPK